MQGHFAWPGAERLDHGDEGSCLLGRFPISLVQIRMVSNSQRARIIISFVLDFFFPGRHHLLRNQYLVTHVFLTDKSPYLWQQRTQPQRGYMTFHLPWKLGVLKEVEAGDARSMVCGKDFPPSSKRTDAASLAVPNLISDSLSGAELGSARGWLEYRSQRSFYPLCSLI